MDALLFLVSYGSNLVGFGQAKSPSCTFGLPERNFQALLEVLSTYILGTGKGGNGRRVKAKERIFRDAETDAL